MKKRILPILLALIMVLTLLPTLALADETVYIDSDEDLVTAIKNQADGQTWVFTEARTYDAINTDEGSNGLYATSEIAGGSNFVFPIYVDNLTITKENGIGEVVITSSARPDAQNGGV
jgi:CRISPR/Cas system CSM-associated protein Csm3 (group 7 of RAMP superfamily)